VRDAETDDLVRGKADERRVLEANLAPLGFTRPVSARKQVVLPAPFAPMRLMIALSEISKDTPLTASRCRSGPGGP